MTIKTLLLNLLFVICFSSLLTSCEQEDASLAYPTVLYIGDSNCNGYNSEGTPAVEYVGLVKHCVNGISLIYSYTNLPDSFDLIFLALGTNDAILNIDINTFYDALQTRLLSTATPVVCVLPTVNTLSTINVHPYRDAMLFGCQYTLDPLDYGITNGSGDNIHWSEQDQELFRKAILDTLQQFQISPSD